MLVVFGGVLAWGLLDASVYDVEKVLELGSRVQHCGTGGPSGRLFNPGWHTALDLPNLLTVSEAVTRSALDRRESRGAHFRTDFPRRSARWEGHIVVSQSGARLVRPAAPASRAPAAVGVARGG